MKQLKTPYGRDLGFGALLQQYRRQAHASQAQLADMSTISVRTIRNLESGKVPRPRPQTARLLAEALSLQGSSLQSFLAFASLPGHQGPHGDMLTVEQFAPPIVSGRIFGREAELAFLLGQLGDRERFINVTGIAGVGKTRLLLELARRVTEAGTMTARWGLISPQEQMDGVRPFTGPIHAHAPVRLKPEQIDPAEFRKLTGGGATLLLLDGSDGAEVEWAWLNAVLSACPSLRVVAASRRPLPGQGKGILPLEPLAVPAGRRDGHFADISSVQHLLSSVKQIRPSFRTGAKVYAGVAEICDLLDGLPLALEWAAFQFLSDSPQAIATRLRHDPFALPHLPAVGDTRYDLRTALGDAIQALDAPLARAMQRLSTLDTDWSVREASERLSWDFTDLISNVYELRMHGLLRCRDEGSEPRFRVLRLIRPLA